MKRITTLLSALMIGGISPIALAESALIAGQVVKVDMSASNITIKHGPIIKLDMDQGMTMVFHAQDPALLKNVKAGDKVNFDAENVNGQLILTKIERSK